MLHDNKDGNDSNEDSIPLVEPTASPQKAGSETSTKECSNNGSSLNGEKGSESFPEGLTVLFGCIKLNVGVRRRNFYSFLIVSASSIMFLVYLNAMQAFLLTSVYGVPQEELGTTTGYLAIADEILSIAALGIWGVCSDVYGRQTVIISGYVLICIGSLLMPHGGRVFPGLLFFRLIYAAGASALSSLITALLSDYVVKEDLGKGSGIFGLMGGLGAILSVFLLVGSVPKSICITNTYYVVAGLAAIMVGVSMFGLQSFKQFQESGIYEKPNNINNPCVLFGEGMKAAKNKRTALAYLTGVLARGESVVISVFISLWVTRLYTEQDLCFAQGNETDLDENVCQESFSDPDAETCPDAFSRFSALTGTAQVAALVFAPVFGYLGDHFDPLIVVTGCSILGAVSFGLVGIINDPQEDIAFLLVVLWGISQIGSVVSSQFFLAKLMPSDIRGTISGCYSIMGGIGVLFYTYVGGVLFDRWYEGGPFVLASVMNGILLCCCVGILLG